jgi:hypothetical protein
VVIADDQRSWSVKFTVSDDLSEIGVFVVGHRIDDFLADLLAKEILIGRAPNQGGAGYVVAHVDKGVLVGIEPNSGIRLLELDEAMKKRISENIVAGERAPITAVTLTAGQGDAN